MKKPLLYLLALLSIVVSSCNKEDEYLPPEPPTKGERHTVILYAVAENSLSPYFRYDLEELTSAKMDVPSDCNFIIYVDDCSSPRLYSLNKQGLSQIKTYQEQNSCDGKVFENTLSEIIELYPSKNYSLVMWSHGSGAVPSVSSIFNTRTIGIDNNENSEYDICESTSELEIPDMATHLMELGVHWNYILFDACFMQSIEVAYELKDVANYIIGSPAEMPGNGLPYHQILQYLFFDGNTVSRNICNIIEDYYHTLYSGKHGVILSAIETSKLDDVASATKQVLRTVDSNMSTFDYSQVQPYCVFEFETLYKPEYYDIGSFIYHAADSKSYDNWNSCMSSALLSRKTADTWVTSYPDFNATMIDRQHVSAVSMFIPNSKYEKLGYNEYQKKFRWYHASGMDQLKY